MKKLLIKNGHVVDPKNKIDEVCDVLIIDGKISKVSKNITEKDAEVFDANGKVVAPGLIDIHVHFREPGQESKETIATGSAAAAAGGFTQVCCMANTNPPIDNRGIVELVRGIAAREAVIKVHPIAAVTKQMGGVELVEMGELLEAGVVAFSDDGLPISNAMVMRRALEYSSQWSAPIMVHEEDLNLVNGGSMNESATSTRLGLPGNPSVAEDVLVARDVELARLGGRIHFAHVSSGRSVEIIRQAKAQGLKVTCETAPHYLTLTDADVDQYNTHFKMAPPLRGFPDQKQLIEGIMDGTIDCIATDHAPHTRDDKNVEFNQAKFGVIGLETSLPVMVSRFVNTGKISWTRLIELMALKPAEIVGLEGGHLSIGMPADVVIIDAQTEKEVQPNLFKSKGRNCPFKGWKIAGWPVATFVAGKRVF